MKVDAAGRTWVVRRRWLPWRTHSNRLLDRLPNPGAGNIVEIPVIGWIIAILLAPLLIVFAVLLTTLMIELLVLLVIFPVAALLRVWLGRHWKVQIGRGRILALHVEGAGTFRAAGLRIRELGAAMERGDYPGLVAQTIEATRQREARAAQDP